MFKAFSKKSIQSTPKSDVKARAENEELRWFHVLTKEEFSALCGASAISARLGKTYEQGLNELMRNGHYIKTIHIPFALDNYRFAAILGDRTAKEKMCEYYLDGRPGLIKNPQFSHCLRNWLDRVSDNNNDYQYNILEHQELTTCASGKISDDKLKEIYQGAQKNIAADLNKLGILFFKKSFDGSLDNKASFELQMQALELIERSALLGNVLAIYNYAYFISRGLGRPVNLYDAYPIFLFAASNGHPKAKAAADTIKKALVWIKKNNIPKEIYKNWAIDTVLKNISQETTQPSEKDKKMMHEAEKQDKLNQVNFYKCFTHQHLFYRELPTIDDLIENLETENVRPIQRHPVKKVNFKSTVAIQNLYDNDSNDSDVEMQRENMPAGYDVNNSANQPKVVMQPSNTISGEHVDNNPLQLLALLASNSKALNVPLNEPLNVPLDSQAVQQTQSLLSPENNSKKRKYSSLLTTQFDQNVVQNEKPNAESTASSVHQTAALDKENIPSAALNSNPNKVVPMDCS